MRVYAPFLGLSLAATAAAAQPLLRVTNQCSENVYVVYSNDQYKAAQVTLTQGKGFQVILSGLGYSVGLSTDPAFYSEAVAKLIFGYSVNTDNGLLYYSIASDYGNPFASQSFSLTGNNGCASVNSPNGVTYACSDAASLYLTLCG
ncbi:hypothetical protein DPSP01_010752 [Paraphaeosphaeria sporulosa]|uniref:Bys1 family protein n=1 Tax=Paraphaeosphaeria sporulosa TaxID=1460663 RepID=A0A177CWG2_9PLEO|nr:uncharacterized protein CC84DRAFT_1170459 [Paraphaeosphaeria sporulosa]OAG11566.1 hypothetical protein CC84DRAFT_1170459 [Paraphaeosphaeria sporulosa]